MVKGRGENLRKTITEKILAEASGRDEVSPGDLVSARISTALTHDVFCHLVFPQVQEIGGKLWDPDRIVMTIDHYVPPSTVEHAEKARKTVIYAKEYKLHLYPYEGVSHQVLAEHGHVLPGTVVVGTDSHTIMAGALGALGTGIGAIEMLAVFLEGSLWFKVPETLRFNVNGSLPKGVVARDVISQIFHEIGPDGGVYKTMEFGGSTVRNMSVGGRMVLSDNSVEVGAKFGLVEPDRKVINYLKGRTEKEFKLVKSDRDAVYKDTYEIEASKLEPMVSVPDHPAYVKSVTEVEGIEIDQAIIGMCSGGRVEDLRSAAKILKGRKAHRNVKFIIVPASQQQLILALKEGALDVLLKANAILCPPGCGPCAGFHEGILASKEVMISTQPRNFRGRSGSPEAEIYLASPITVAASAVQGKITDPREFL